MWLVLLLTQAAGVSVALAAILAAAIVMSGPSRTKGERLVDFIWAVLVLTTGLLAAHLIFLFTRH